jgi:hypothetical protein
MGSNAPAVVGWRAACVSSLCFFGCPVWSPRLRQVQRAVSGGLQDTGQAVQIVPERPAGSVALRRPIQGCRAAVRRSAGRVRDSHPDCPKSASRWPTSAVSRRLVSRTNEQGKRNGRELLPHKVLFFHHIHEGR